jgi:hypothetical protein
MWPWFERPTLTDCCCGPVSWCWLSLSTSALMEIPKCSNCVFIVFVCMLADLVVGEVLRFVRRSSNLSSCHVSCVAVRSFQKPFP